MKVDQKRVEEMSWEILKLMRRDDSSIILGIKDILEVSPRNNSYLVNSVFYEMKQTGLVKDAILNDIDLGVSISEDHIELTKEGLAMVTRFNTYSKFRYYKRKKSFFKAISSNWTINGVVFLLAFLGGVVSTTTDWLGFSWKGFNSKSTKNSIQYQHQKTDSPTHKQDTSGFHESMPLP